LSFKPLFSRSLSADPGRLHFAAHSHHLWPDASFAGHMQAWEDAARFADRKWDKVMDEVWPEAQREVAAELGTGQADAIVFAPNTHELLVRLMAAVSETWPIRVLTSDGEFHSARRQFARWEESGAAVFERMPVEPFDSFSERFLAAAEEGSHDVIFVSQVMFGSGRIFERVDQLAALGRRQRPWIVIDGYHAFMAIDRPFSEAAGQTAF
jgi:selenocysteine lyase/cysteine desulfurase